MGEDLRNSVNALRTCRGQLDGIISMLEEGRNSIEVSNQIMAAQAMLKRANKLLLVKHLDACVREAVENPNNPAAPLADIGPLMNKLLEP